MNPKPRKEIDTSTYTGRFAARLKMLREKTGLSVQDAADALGVTVYTVYKYEDGTRTPLVADFPKIAELYRVKKTKDLLPNE